MVRRKNMIGAVDGKLQRVKDEEKEEAWMGLRV